MRAIDYEELPIDIKESLLKKIFQHIIARNYYIDENTELKVYMLQEESRHIIEEFFIRHANLEYVYTKNHELPVSDPNNKLADYNSMKYFDLAGQFYQTLATEINLFFKINKEKEKYYSEPKDIDKNRNIFLHSIEIVRKEIESIKEIYPDLYKEIKIYIENFEIQINSKDFRQNKYSGLLSYIDVLKESNTNFILKSKYGKSFYPLIVDSFLDYSHIMATLNTCDDFLKNKRKRYKNFRNKLVNSRDEIDPILYYLIKFTKLERVDNIKRYILYFYLEEFNHNKNINTLFRKLFLTNLKGRDTFRPSDMKTYQPKIHMIFMTLTNSKYFL